MATILARLTCDEPAARRLATFFDERLGDDVAVAAFENDAGQWAVEITFATAPDQNAIRELVEAGGGDPAELRFSELSEKDWVAASLADLTPVRAGRFLVHGAHHRGLFPANLAGIEIEAALAFGTGHHGTTRGCLLALDTLLKRRRRMRALDVGTGTGVLAIAAAKSLHQPVVTTDIDPVAVRTANANARHNGVAAFITNRVADGRRGLPWRGPFDVILANILLGPLTRMAPQLARRLAPGGFIVLSGLLPSQANAAVAAYRAQGLALVRRGVLENWATLVMQRRQK
ncbi:MAG TPA: 50S ribosomal protein L11 methyltransferase [Pseudolabrys sp.]|nr:50S ribosomal protein L11 methyltransferase [Pseudolabrys sp.]